MLARAFTEVEAKLLRLALCPAAQPGEVENASCALVLSWRKRGILAEALLSNSAAERPAIERPRRPAFSPGDVLMPFGKCRGLPLHKIKRSYLRWVLNNCDSLQPELSRAINAVLYG